MPSGNELRLEGIPAILGIILRWVNNLAQDRPFMYNETAAKQAEEMQRQQSFSKVLELIKGSPDPERYRLASKLAMQAGDEQTAMSLAKAGQALEETAASNKQIRAGQLKKIEAYNAPQGPSTLQPPAANSSGSPLLQASPSPSIKENPYLPQLQKIAEEQGIQNKPLFYSLAHLETANFDPNAVSPKGAIGLMQIMPETGARFGASAKTLKDPVVNMTTSARYFKVLEDEFGPENHDKIAAAYNAGEGSVRKYGGVPPFPETQKYVKNVQGFRQYYVTQQAQQPKPLPVDQPVPLAEYVQPGFDRSLPPGMTLTSHANGDVTITEKSPTMDELKYATWEKANSAEKALIAQGIKRELAGMPVMRKFEMNQLTGRNELHEVDPINRTQRVTVMGSKTQQTPEDRTLTEVTREDLKRKTAAITGITPVPGLGEKTFGQLETEAKGPTAEMNKAAISALASSSYFSRFYKDVTDAGRDAQGRFDMGNLPLGPYSKFRMIPEHYKITESSYAVKQQTFILGMTKAIANLYDVAGQQLGYKEIENLEAYRLNPSLAPIEWIPRMAQVWEDGLDKLKARIEVEGKNHDVSHLVEAYKEASKFNPWFWLRPELRPARIRGEQ
jgi:soluble lytic murein transglycosylase-like protein